MIRLAWSAASLGYISLGRSYLGIGLRLATLAADLGKVLLNVSVWLNGHKSLEPGYVPA